MKARTNFALRLLRWTTPVALLAAASCQAPPATVSDSATAADSSIGVADSTTAPQSDPTPDSAGAPGAVAVIRRYYQAINGREFRTAYELWGERGAASGRSFAEFADGFAATGHVAVDIGEPGPVGAAAGSRYVEIPVVIRAETTDRRQQRFEGSYTLRRSVVDGASPEQRRWHIYTAKIVRTR